MAFLLIHTRMRFTFSAASAHCWLICSLDTLKPVPTYCCLTSYFLLYICVFNFFPSVASSTGLLWNSVWFQTVSVPRSFWILILPSWMLAVVFSLVSSVNCVCPCYSITWVVSEHIQYNWTKTDCYGIPLQIPAYLDRETMITIFWEWL